MAATDQPTAFEEAATVLGGGPLNPGTPRPGYARPGSHATPSSSGWLSSGSHGRFEPGALLADRYRIVARLGQGGMGEVYRADDLKLGQPVALKFLPPALEHDPVRLAQFHNEVRLARQIAHKNVCRMYDVGDADGLPFLTMEYVDGEDLASLLRRIGRLAEDKALDLARQLCAGLAAAHERGVLHRDLKPANVMVDGQGQVRITDFGLAAIAGEVDQVRVGTPAYMAPEQLAGKSVSVQSDVYALGLVLYELFTGRRAFAAQNVAELVRLHEQRSITPPTDIVRDLNPAIERAILRCLESDPAARPRSALAVSAALPGGDPLAAALAAGETPSPEMVAAAGERHGTSPLRAAATAAAILALLLVGAALLARHHLSNQVPFDKPPAVLVDRAQQALATLGYRDVPASTHWGFSSDIDYLRYLGEHPEFARQQHPFTSRPYGLQFSYRTSPRRLVPLNMVGAVSVNDPPLVISGMTLVTLNTAGELEGFSAIPPQRDLSSGPPPTVDWVALFRAAGLDMSRFSPAQPEWLPRGEADVRMAWTGTIPARPATPLRVEAAAWRGRVISLQLVWPWTTPRRMEEAPVTTAQRWMSGLNVAFFFLLLLAALVVSRTNVRAGRGDHRGALRLVTFAVSLQMVTWLLNDPHGAEPQVELYRFFLGVGEALFGGAMLYMMYLALEPAVRRYWPDGLLGWTRLVHGHFIDARVGRDLLAGLAGGAVIVLLFGLRWPLQSAFGHSNPVGALANLRVYEGPMYVAGLFSSFFGYQSIFNAMWCVFAIVGLKRLLRNMWLVGIAASLFFTLVAAGDLYTDQDGHFWLHFAIAVTAVSVIVMLTIRFGLLSTAAAFLATNWVTNIPWTLASSRWDFPTIAAAFLLLAAVAVFAGWAARAPSSPGARPAG